MRKAPRYARTSALPAIAAALALSSTTALAQDPPSTAPDPVASEPAPTVTTEPAPVLESAPATVPDAPAVEPAAKPKRTVAKAKPPASAAARPVAHKARATQAAVPASAAPAPAPAAPVPAAAPAKPVPAVDLSTKPAPTQTAAKPAGNPNETAMELGGGALALIVLGAGAYALARRRRPEDDEIVDEAYEPEAVAVAEPEPRIEPAARHDAIPQEQPVIVAPDASAFAWDNPQPAPVASDDDGSDRQPGESWVERAHRGPSPANPSVSLRARLKRAAFFDKREREVAAGTAEPIETDAGLPDAMVEEQEGELA
jgi:resuscitation-promoting factor RpfA